MISGWGGGGELSIVRKAGDFSISWISKSHWGKGHPTVNPCFQMFHLISHLSYIGCDVGVKLETWSRTTFQATAVAIVLITWFCVNGYYQKMWVGSDLFSILLKKKLKKNRIKAKDYFESYTLALLIDISKIPCSYLLPSSIHIICQYKWS